MKNREKYLQHIHIDVNILNTTRVLKNQYENMTAPIEIWAKDFYR